MLILITNSYTSTDLIEEKLMLETKQHEYAVRQKDTQMAGEKSRKITENAGVQSQQSFQIPFTVRLSDSFSQDPSDFFVLQ